MGRKLNEVLKAFKSIINDFNIDTVLTTKFDEFGEIVHDSVVDRFKKEFVGIMEIVKGVSGWKWFLSL